MHDFLSRTARLDLLSPDAIRRLNAELLTPVLPVEQPMPIASSGPRVQYEYWRPWWERFAAKGCKRCGGDPQGWLQTQLQTPYRFKRLLLWTINLVPRGVSMIRVVTSKRVSSAQYAERQASCGSCPAAVIQLRVRGGKVHEASHCGVCDCPKWFGSRNEVRNKRSAWRCPIKRHAGSDRDAVLAEFVRGKMEQADSGSNGRGDNGNG